MKKQDEYAVDETPAEFAISGRHRRKRPVPQKIKPEDLAREPADGELERFHTPLRDPERH